MFRGAYQSLATSALILGYYAIDVWLMRRHDPARSEGSARSWSWTLVSVALAAIVILQPVLLPGIGFYTDAWWGLAMQIAGLGVMAGGLALIWWARSHLRHFFGERVEIQEGQYLVETGPYAYVRHPIYSAFFLCVAGLLLVNPALTTLAVVAYFVVDFPRATRQEERLLSADLPGYREYMARTSRYVPSLRKILREER
ncbi:MAG: isoprenylcysteine carboxylmethyltransferase family protein [Anaerolineae bacterium]|jgi:protein-S-isoprenylcysteine O-methyltransferase Ste14